MDYIKPRLVTLSDQQMAKGIIPPCQNGGGNYQNCSFGTNAGMGCANGSSASFTCNGGTNPGS